MATKSTMPALPLRTALIGLSAGATTSWAANAHLPGLLTARGKRDFVITALCNSSVDAAKAAIEAYNLPATTKAYGTPRDLAEDADIDVVICCTRVDRHFETVKDSVVAGKRVYVEWPVTQSVEKTVELGRLARESGSVVAVGLQGRWAPPVAKIRELLESVVDYVQSVLGNFVEGTTTAKTQIQFPKNNVFDPKTKEVQEVMATDVPDLIVVAGNIPESKTVTKDATVSLRFRRGPPFKGEPALTWSISCERGEIRLISPSGVSLQADAYAEPHSLQIHWYENDSIEDAMWSWDAEQQEVPVQARSVMKTLYAYAEGDENSWTSLESATLRAKQIDGWIKQGEW